MEHGGELRGRTLLQKKLYFVSVLAGEQSGYSPHYYGPYSSLVADDLGALVNAGFVQGDTDVFSEMLGPWGERRLCKYRLREPSAVLIRSREMEMGAYQDAIERINADPISQNAHLLSIAAKVHIIVSERGEVTLGAIKQRAAELGWKLSDRDIQQVAGYLQRLGLVTEKG